MTELDRLRAAVIDFLDNTDVIEEHQGGNRREWAQNCRHWLYPNEIILSTDKHAYDLLKALTADTPTSHAEEVAAPVADPGINHYSTDFQAVNPGRFGTYPPELLGACLGIIVSILFALGWLVS
jgi:hypothetical protein